MKTKKLHEILLTTCFLTVTFVACQQTTQTELTPTPNAQTNQFTVQQAWSSVESQSPMYLNKARWRNNNEALLSGNAAVLWATDDLSQKMYGRDTFDYHIYGTDWNAEWNPQGTQLLSSELIWDADSVAVPPDQENQYRFDSGSLIPSKIIFDFGAEGGNKIVKWNSSGLKSAVTTNYGSYTYKIVILDMTNKQKKDYVSDSYFNSIEWISENQILALVSKNIFPYEKIIEIINTDTLSIEKSIKLEDFFINNNLSALESFSPISRDQKEIYAISFDSNLKSYFLKLDPQTFEIKSKVPTDQINFNYASIQWLDDNKTTVALLKDYTIKFVDTETGKLTFEIKKFKSFKNLQQKNQIYEFQVSPDKSKFIIGGSGNNFLAYNTDTANYIGCILCLPPGHNTNTYQIALDKNSNSVYSVGRDTTLIVNNLKDGAALDAQKLSQLPVYAIANSSDGNTYATAGEDGIIHLWDTTTQAETGSLTGHTYNVRALSWKPNSPTLASAGWDDTVRLWDTSTQTLTATLTDHTNYVNAVQYNPSGTELASASSDGTIKLRNPDTGETLHTLQPADSSAKVFAIAYSSDGTHIASGSDDHRVRIWNTQTQTLEATLKGHLGAVRTVIWLNPTTLVTGGMDGRIIFWDTTNQQMIQELKPNLGAVFTITATTDGSQLFAGFDSGNIVSWKVTR